MRVGPDPRPAAPRWALAGVFLGLVAAGCLGAPPRTEPPSTALTYELVPYNYSVPYAVLLPVLFHGDAPHPFASKLSFVTGSGNWSLEPGAEGLEMRVSGTGHLRLAYAARGEEAAQWANGTAERWSLPLSPRPPTAGPDRHELGLNVTASAASDLVVDVRFSYGTWSNGCGTFTEGAQTLVASGAPQWTWVQSGTECT